MFVRNRDSLRDLIRNQHEEFMRYQDRREEEFRSLVEETRGFNREILLRNEKVYMAAIVQLEENTEQTRANIEETRAQTQALLRLIDRFDEPDGAAAA